MAWNSDLIPYVLLLFSILTGWAFSPRIALLVLSSAIAAAFALGRIGPTALCWIAVLGGSIWLPQKLKLAGWRKLLCYGAFLIVAFSMSSHLASGFNNLSIFQATRFSADSVPFTMFLNFDKAVVGLLIYLFLVKPSQPRAWTRAHLVTSMKVLAFLLVLIIPIAMAINYIRVDFKFPELGWLWILNNLFFVCLAEEGLFRGFIQKVLSDKLSTTIVGLIFSIVVSAVLFGLAHYRGGSAYVMLATVAGLFYGYAFHKTQRLESSILVHFGLNLVHFLFFSYPALASN